MDGIIQQIETLEEALFYLEMKDHWDQQDFQQFDSYVSRIKELKAKLEENEGCRV